MALATYGILLTNICCNLEDSLFHLIEYYNFWFVLELRDLILYYIRNLFMTSGMKVKCSIIVMLNRFVQNLVSGTVLTENNFPVLKSGKKYKLIRFSISILGHDNVCMLSTKEYKKQLSLYVEQR